MPNNGGGNTVKLAVPIYLWSMLVGFAVSMAVVFVSYQAPDAMPFIVAVFEIVGVAIVLLALVAGFWKLLDRWCGPVSP